MIGSCRDRHDDVLYARRVRIGVGLRPHRATLSLAVVGLALLGEE